MVAGNTIPGVIGPGMKIANEILNIQSNFQGLSKSNTSSYPPFIIVPIARVDQSCKVLVR
jgi:hypothetical protein